MKFNKTPLKSWKCFEFARIFGRGVELKWVHWIFASQNFILTSQQISLIYSLLWRINWRKWIKCGLSIVLVSCSRVFGSIPNCWHSGADKEIRKGGCYLFCIISVLKQSKADPSSFFPSLPWFHRFRIYSDSLKVKLIWSFDTSLLATNITL